jgi:hypothetical protein
MPLTNEQIKGFKEKEGKAKSCYELKEIADNISEAIVNAFPRVDISISSYLFCSKT